MKMHLLFLCLLGCTRLLLVVGHPLDQRRAILKIKTRVVDLRQDAVEQRKEHSALVNDDSGGVRPDIIPYGVRLEDVNNNSNSTNETTSATTSYVTVDITPTATTSATGGSSTFANLTTSVPGQPTTSSVSSASTSVHLATSTPVTASVSSTSRVPARPTSSTSGVPSPTNIPTTKPRVVLTPLEIAGCVLGGIAFVVILSIVLVVCAIRFIARCMPRPAYHAVDIPPSPNAGERDDYGECLSSFLDQHPEYQEQRHKRRDLGSRMQKRWYQVDNGQEKKILTIAPVSQHCPLMLHEHQKGLNKLLRVLKEHPYLHSIELVEYLPHHELLVMVQPLIEEGSLKDMIYKATPLTNWSDKYARRSSGLPPEKITHYGRQILEAMKFLYSKGFPTLGHVQSGNIFVVNDVCHLGGYENTLLGYKTRLFRLCKDHLQYFDVILFGHLVFEMAAGYELTHLRPSEAEYKNVDKSVRPILEHIFEEGFPNDINEISKHEFFSDSSSESNNFDPSQVQLSDSMNKVLEKVRKGKVRVQKSMKHTDGTETLAAKFKTTFRGLTLEKFGRGGEDAEGNLTERDLEKKQIKTQKVKSSKDNKCDETTHLLTGATAPTN